MVPLKILVDGEVHYIEHGPFKGTVTELCQKHKDENRAIAFAFLIFDFEHPQLIKVLDDKEYWNALHAISGELLSIFYIHSREQNFAEDLKKSDCLMKRGLYPCTADQQYQEAAAILKNFFVFDGEVKLPSVLFFQTSGQMVEDYFLIELKEERIEESFIELKSYIKAAVERLNIIDAENYDNTTGIFENLKQGVTVERNRRIISRNISKFPIQLLLSWILGKL